MKYDIFGKILIVEQVGNGWVVFYPGADGKKRMAENIIIPSFLCEAEILKYLEDICHEWACGPDSKVKIV